MGEAGERRQPGRSGLPVHVLAALREDAQMLRTRRWLILLAVLILAFLLIAPSPTGARRARTIDVMPHYPVGAVPSGVTSGVPDRDHSGTGVGAGGMKEKGGRS